MSQITITRRQFDEAVKSIVTMEELKGKQSPNILVFAELLNRRLFGQRDPNDPENIPDYEVEWAPSIDQQIKSALDELMGPV